MIQFSSMVGIYNIMKVIPILLLALFSITNQISLEEYEQLQQKEMKVLLSDVELQDKHNHPEIKKLIFTTPWGTSAKTHVLKYGHKINYVSPCWYELQLDKNSHPVFQNEHNFDQTFYNDLRKRHPHIKILPRVYLPANNAQFVQKIGTNRNQFQRAVKLITSLFIAKGFDGFVWDSPFNFFQMSRQSLNNLLVEFLRSVRTQLGKDKLIFFNMANPADHMKKLDMASYSGLDIDALLIQNYDKGGRYLDIIDRSIQWFKTTNKKIELILMLPFFSVQDNNSRSLSTEQAAQNLKQKGISSARMSGGMCLYGQSNTRSRYYIPCYSYFKTAFDKAKKNSAHVGFWQGGNGLEVYYKFF